MSNGKALAREIAKRRPARFVKVKTARMERAAMEDEPGRRGQDLMKYEAAAWHSPNGVDL